MLITNKRTQPLSVRHALATSIATLDYTRTLPRQLEDYVAALPPEHQTIARAACLRTYSHIRLFANPRIRQVLAWLDGVATARDVEKGLHTEHGRHRPR